MRGWGSWGGVSGRRRLSLTGEQSTGTGVPRGQCARLFVSLSAVLKNRRDARFYVTCVLLQGTKCRKPHPH